MKKLIFNDWNLMVQLFNEVIFKADKKQVHQLINIYDPNQNFVEKPWKTEVKMRYFTSTVLLYEPKSAPFTFLKVIKCLSSLWII